MKLRLFLAAMLLVGFAQAETIWVNGVSLESGWTDYNKNNVEDGDDYLCWAAAASNIINWWQNQYVAPPAAPRGEEIWNTFKNSTDTSLDIEDRGGNPQCAFQWWLTGIYDIFSTKQQDSQNLDYRYSYVGMEPGSSVAIKNETINQQSGFTGYYRALEESLPSSATYFNPWNIELAQFFTKQDGYAITASNQQDAELTSLAALSFSVVECISAGAGVTLSLQTADSAHAVTLWGVDYNTETNMLEGLWLTDSDDNRAGGIFADQDLFYASIGQTTGTYTLTSTAGDGSTITWEEERTILTLNTKTGWLQNAQIQEFLFFNTSVSDNWGLERVPEPATATLSLLALAGLAARRRRH